jgi:hypothetical protein
MEIESEMDNYFLYGHGVDDGEVDRITMPQFGDRVDAIVDDVSSTFLAYAEEHADDMTETDKVWIEGERIRALKQILGGGKGTVVQRLYHLNMQGLRDFWSTVGGRARGWSRCVGW